MINAGGAAVSRAGSALPAGVTLIMEAEKPQQRHSAGAAHCVSAVGRREGNSWLLVPRKHQPKVSFLCGVGGCGQHSA